MSQTTGGKPTPVKGLNSPRPSKKASVTRQPGAKSVSGGTGAKRHLDNPTTPREKGIDNFGETVVNSNGFKNIDPIYANYHNKVDAPVSDDSEPEETEKNEEG